MRKTVISQFKLPGLKLYGWNLRRNQILTISSYDWYQVNKEISLKWKDGNYGYDINETGIERQRVPKSNAINFKSNSTINSNTFLYWKEFNLDPIRNDLYTILLCAIDKESLNFTEAKPLYMVNVNCHSHLWSDSEIGHK